MGYLNDNISVNATFTKCKLFYVTFKSLQCTVPLKINYQPTTILIIQGYSHDSVPPMNITQ